MLHFNDTHIPHIKIIHCRDGIDRSQIDSDNIHDRLIIINTDFTGEIDGISNSSE